MLMYEVRDTTSPGNTGILTREEVERHFPGVAEYIGAEEECGTIETVTIGATAITLTE